MTRENLVFVGYSFADTADDFFRINAAAMHTLDFLHHDQRFLAVFVWHRKYSTTVLAQCGVAVLHCSFDVLRIMINTADDNEFLDAAGDEQFPRVVHKTEIAGTQPGWPLLAIYLRLEGRSGSGFGLRQ